MNTDVIFDAISLFKFAMDAEKATLPMPLTDCEIYYIPRMPYYHREFWYQKTIILFCKNEYDSDVIRTDEGNLFLWPNETYSYNEFKKIICMNLIYPTMDDIDNNPAIIPLYYSLDPNLMTKMLDNTEKYLVLR